MVSLWKQRYFLHLLTFPCKRIVRYPTTLIIPHHCKPLAAPRKERQIPERSALRDAVTPSPPLPSRTFPPLPVNPL